MAEDGLVIWQHLADGDSFHTAFVTISVEGVGGVTHHEEPVGFSFAAHAGFVSMEEARRGEVVADWAGALTPDEKAAVMASLWSSVCPGWQG